jgi:hypothetical protein
MKHIFFSLILVVFSFFLTKVLNASPRNGIHYKGGMQYHVRYAKLNLPETSLSAAGTGLGGRAAFYIVPNLRIGGMGFKSSWSYSTPVEKNNFVEIGFGGITLEYIVSIKKFALSAGICGGGGRVKYLHSIIRGTPYSTVRYESKASMIVQPILTTEYKLTEKISAAVMFDWLYAQALPVSNHCAPAVHLGILFGR